MAGPARTKNRSSPKGEGLPPEEVIFGCSPAMLSIRETIKKIIPTDVPILIQGENGTGKGLLAQYIHNNSAFSSGQFVKVNCAAIPSELLESELFGYEEGAFTNAVTSKPGYVEMAHRGTLFLDEIADLNINLQPKVLQLLQDGQFSRMGDRQERHAEIRVICATSRNLQSEIEGGRFRCDLFYRINVISIKLPSLRERREDIAPLSSYFLKQLNARFERDAPPFPEEVTESLVYREWRGNIRELENLVARYTILGSLDSMTPEPMTKRFLAPHVRVAVDGTIPLKRIAKQAVREMEGNLILKALRENRWNRRKAAENLKISYRTLLYQMREIGLLSKRSRGQGSKVSDNGDDSPPATE